MNMAGLSNVEISAVEAKANPEAGSKIQIIQWPVIIHSSVQNSTIGRMLAGRLKPRFSDSIIKNSVIFPLSGISILLIDSRYETLDDICCDKVAEDSSTTESSNSEIIDRINRLISTHKFSYVIFISSSSLPHQAKTSSNVKCFNLLQDRYLFTSLQFILVDNDNDAVESMCNIAKVKYRQNADLLWSRLKEYCELSPDVSVQFSAFRLLGLTDNECSNLSQTLGCLSSLATVEESTLISTGLSADKCKRVLSLMDSTL